jgi:hypothetical protein
MYRYIYEYVYIYTYHTHKSGSTSGKKHILYPAVTKWSTPRNGVQTHSKQRINCEYSILYLQLFRDFEWVCTPFRGVLHFVTGGYMYVYKNMLMLKYIYEYTYINMHIIRTNQDLQEVYIYPVYVQYNRMNISVHTNDRHVHIYAHVHSTHYIYHDLQEVYSYPIYTYIDISTFMYIHVHIYSSRCIQIRRMGSLFISYIYIY